MGWVSFSAPPHSTGDQSAYRTLVNYSTPTVIRLPNVKRPLPPKFGRRLPLDFGHAYAQAVETRHHKSDISRRRFLHFSPANRLTHQPNTRRVHGERRDA